MCLAVKILYPEIVVYTQVIIATCSNSTVTNFNGICTIATNHIMLCVHTLASADYA